MPKKKDLWFDNNPSGLGLTLRSVHNDVKTSEFRDFDDRAMFHDLALDRTLLFQRQMRTGSVVIAEVLGQHPLQMTSAHDNEVIQAHPSYGFDQTFRVGILPGMANSRHQHR